MRDPPPPSGCISNEMRNGATERLDRGDRVRQIDGTAPARPTVELLAAALEAVLAEIAGEAFVVGADGVVLYANPAARARIAREGEKLASYFAATAKPFRRCVLQTGAGATAQVCTLIFAPRPTSDRVITAAARRWSLTRRETEVLTRMIAGDFNKEIACVLACSRRAVEHHITSILRKTRTHSRADLLGRVFTDVASTEEDDQSSATGPSPTRPSWAG
jgi:DNA-binding CsgD family transcriptional regulator